MQKMKVFGSPGEFLFDFESTGDPKKDQEIMEGGIRERGAFEAPATKLEAALDTARAFRRAAEYLWTHQFVLGHDVIVPLCVNAAFGVETYLKVLVLGFAPEEKTGGHDLLALYRRLPPAAIEAIQHACARVAPLYKYGPTDGIADHLESIAKAFELWRYPWEKDFLGYFDIKRTRFVLEALEVVCDAQGFSPVRLDGKL